MSTLRMVGVVAAQVAFHKASFDLGQAYAPDPKANDGQSPHDCVFHLIHLMGHQQTVHAKLILFDSCKASALGKQ